MSTRSSKRTRSSTAAAAATQPTGRSSIQGGYQQQLYSQNGGASSSSSKNSKRRRTAGSDSTVRTTLPQPPFFACIDFFFFRYNILYYIYFDFIHPFVVHVLPSGCWVSPQCSPSLFPLVLHVRLLRHEPTGRLTTIMMTAGAHTGGGPGQAGHRHVEEVPAPLRPAHEEQQVGRQGGAGPSSGQALCRPHRRRGGDHRDFCQHPHAHHSLGEASADRAGHDHQHRHHSPHRPRRQITTVDHCNSSFSTHYKTLSLPHDPPCASSCTSLAALAP